MLWCRTGISEINWKVTGRKMESLDTRKLMSYTSKERSTEQLNSFKVNLHKTFTNTGQCFHPRRWWQEQGFGPARLVSNLWTEMNAAELIKEPRAQTTSVQDRAATSACTEGKLTPAQSIGGQLDTYGRSQDGFSGPVCSGVLNTHLQVCVHE